MKILFHFDQWHQDVWSGRPIDYDCWFSMQSVWGIDELAVVNNSYIPLESFGRDIKVYETIEAFTNDNPNDLKVHMELQFNNPDELLTGHTINHDAWYMFGPANGWVGNYLEGSATLAIPQKGVDSIHAPFACAALLSHVHMVEST